MYTICLYRLRYTAAGLYHQSRANLKEISEGKSSNKQNFEYTLSWFCLEGQMAKVWISIHCVNSCIVGLDVRDLEEIGLEESC